MIHYHGCPITPRSELLTLAGRFFCNSFADARDTKTCHEIGQGNMLDNGAYSLWTQGRKPDWERWADWVQPWLDYKTTWAVLPDVIDGSEEANDRLVTEYAWVTDASAPVWHLHESFARLLRLCDTYGRVCFGSSGAYREVGTDLWHRRVTDAFNTITDQDGRVRVWVHMLRGMSLAGDIYPFASVDSTDVGRNHHLPHKNARAMVERWDALQCPARWTRREQLSFYRMQEAA